MTPEDRLAQFKASMVMIRHLAESTSDEKQAEFFFRELEKECHKLAPKFRKGNELSQRLARNRLQDNGLGVVHSARVEPSTHVKTK